MREKGRAPQAEPYTWTARVQTYRRSPRGAGMSRLRCRCPCALESGTLVASSWAGDTMGPGLRRVSSSAYRKQPMSWPRRYLCRASLTRSGPRRYVASTSLWIARPPPDLRSGAGAGSQPDHAIPETDGYERSHEDTKAAPFQVKRTYTTRP